MRTSQDGSATAPTRQIAGLRGTRETDLSETVASPEEVRERIGDAATRVLLHGGSEGAARCLSSGDVLGGRYRLGELLGRGAFGVVFRALDLESGERVALKILSSQLTSLRRRFRRGAKLACAFRHPNVVPTRSLGRDGELDYQAMELPRCAEDLEQVLEREGRLPWEEAVSLAIDLLRGLHYMHQRAIVHRDVKPSNVLRVTREGSSSARLIDYDLAKTFRVERVEDSGLWQLETGPLHYSGSAGTPFYMSLARLQGAAATPADDVYAAALILYQLLTGSLPTDQPEPPQTVAQLELARLRPPPPVAGVPLSLQRVLQRALAPHPEQRYASAASLLTSLKVSRICLAA